MRELRDNPVEATFSKGGTLHEIRLKDIENFISTSSHFKNINLSQLEKSEQQKFKLRVIHLIKRANSVHGDLRRNTTNIYVLERLFRPQA